MNTQYAMDFVHAHTKAYHINSQTKNKVYQAEHRRYDKLYTIPAGGNQSYSCCLLFSSLAASAAALSFNSYSNIHLSRKN